MSPGSQPACILAPYGQRALLWSDDMRASHIGIGHLTDTACSSRDSSQRCPAAIHPSQQRVEVRFSHGRMTWTPLLSRCRRMRLTVQTTGRRTVRLRRWSPNSPMPTFAVSGEHHIGCRTKEARRGQSAHVRQCGGGGQESRQGELCECVAVLKGVSTERAAVQRGRSQPRRRETIRVVCTRWRC